MKFKFYGIGGQGIKTLASSLGEILTSIDGSFVTVTADYDTIVRGTNMQADMINSTKRINSPEVSQADICVILNNPDTIVPASTYIADLKSKEKLEAPSMPTAGKTQYYDMTSIATELGAPIFQNMVALGILLKICEVEITKIDLKPFLPKTKLEENLKAITAGFEMA